jgi:hypothetical protein
MGDIKAGMYKGRAVEGSEARGYSKNGNPELTFNVEFALDGGEVTRKTVVLYFSDEAAPYSFERLRACGWTGTDLSEPLKGLGANEVPIEVSYSMFDGAERMKVQIATGKGQFVTRNPEPDSRAWAAKVAALSGAPVGPANAPKPNF